MTLDWLTGPMAIALWGAGTGTIALSIQLTNYWRDRAIVELMPKHHCAVDVRSPEGRLVFVLEVVNHGRRSIYLEDAGIEMPPTKNPAPGTWGHKSVLKVFPENAGGIHVGEGQKVRIIQDPFLPDIAKILGAQATCFVKDTRGRIFKKKFYVTSLPPKKEPLSTS